MRMYVTRMHLAKIATLMVFFVIHAAAAFCQAGGPRGSIVVPSSSIEKPDDLGKRAHTNVRAFMLLNVVRSNRAAAGTPPYSGVFFEPPASIACVYKLVKTASGCNPTTVTINANGGSKAIAIVDAFDNPHAAS